MERDHPAEEMAIVTAEVDAGIAPVVRFLNRFPGVRTLGSCQGGPEGEGRGEWLPYASFAADDTDSLRDLLRTLSPAPCEVTVEWGNDLAPFRFVLRLMGQGHLRDLVRWVGTQG